MAGRLLQRDTVTVNRYDGTGAIDEWGHESTALASGFPLTAKGYFRHKSTDSPVSFGGRDRSVDAEFISSSYHDGEIGDKITKGSNTFLVVARSHKDDSTGNDDHTRYTLSQEGTGDGTNVS